MCSLSINALFKGLFTFARKLKQIASLIHWFAFEQVADEHEDGLLRLADEALTIGERLVDVRAASELGDLANRIASSWSLPANFWAWK